MSILSRIADRFFPISNTTRILATHLSMAGGATGTLDSKTQEIYVSFKNFGPYTRAQLGANESELFLLIEKTGISIGNTEKEEVHRVNFRERKILQQAIIEWLQLENIEFEVME